MENLIALKSYGPTLGVLWAKAAFATNPGDHVAINTPFGTEVAIVQTFNPPANINQNYQYPEVVRVLTDFDMSELKRNLRDAEMALDYCKRAVERLGLEMRLLSCHYSLNRTKLLFIYTADERVDFRGLLREISVVFRTRIELRQIGARDRSQLVGGYAACGMPLCCHNFINDFEGISINMAKNQMLTLNLQKLSGHCGKLLCCLKYEDEFYVKARENLPKFGVRVTYQEREYRLSNYNLIANTARLENADGYITIDLDVLRELLD